MVKGKELPPRARREHKGSDCPAWAAESQRGFPGVRFTKTWMQWMSLRKCSLPSTAEQEAERTGKIGRSV